MGGQQSVNSQELIAEFLSIIPANHIDVGIDETLLRYSGTNSAARLVEYSSNLQTEVGTKLPDFIEKAAGHLGGFTPVPNAVGLGAFIISMILQAVFSITMGKQGPSQKDMLRSVFAEEKASRVRDLIVEYLKRHEMNMRDERWLLADSEELEKQLSLQLSILGNSILMDGQMSSRAVKHWVNGAVFHTQVLLHIPRLRKRTGTQGFESAKRAVSGAAAVYNRDMKKILEAYKAYKRTMFHLKRSTGCGSPGKFCLSFCNFKESEINYSSGLDMKYCSYMGSDAFLNYTFSNHKHLREIEGYFSNVQKNLEVLVNQEGIFQIKS